MVKWIDTLKYEPFSLTLFPSDSDADVDDDDRVDKSFIKLFIVSKKKILSSKMQLFQKNRKRKEKK